MLHRYGAFIHGLKTLFHLVPLAEAFVRGYLDVFKTLLELGARPTLDLERNTFRTFGSQLFLPGDKGRQAFIQLLYDHGELFPYERFDEFLLCVGANIENELKLHTIRIEPDGVFRLEPELQFTCDPICIMDVDPSIIVKWMCKDDLIVERHLILVPCRSNAFVERVVPIGFTSILFLLFRRWLSTIVFVQRAMPVQPSLVQLPDV